MQILNRVRDIAAEKKCTPVQLALAWVMAMGKDIVPIPGTKHVKYLEENMAALEITLTKQDLDRINVLLPPGIAAGMRYPEAMMKAVNK